MIENWRPVLAYDGFYEVSDHGRVRRVAGSNRSPNGRVLRFGVLQRGHLNVGLSRPGVPQLKCLVHVLVLEAFVCLRPTGCWCRHIDGNPANNHLANLAWGTPRENSADMLLHGTRVSDLTAEQVQEIRARHPRESLRVLAAAYDTTFQNVYHIVTGRSWKHLPLGQKRERQRELPTEAYPSSW